MIEIEEDEAIAVNSESASIHRESTAAEASLTACRIRTHKLQHPSASSPWPLVLCSSDCVSAISRDSSRSSIKRELERALRWCLFASFGFLLHLSLTLQSDQFSNVAFATQSSAKRARKQCRQTSESANTRDTALPQLNKHRVQITQTRELTIRRWATRRHHARN